MGVRRTHVTLSLPAATTAVILYLVDGDDEVVRG
jgi:hypothetical protein